MLKSLQKKLKFTHITFKICIQQINKCNAAIKVFLTKHTFTEIL